jgi:pimeloyl-ACP methyl ester carboxylesterase
MSSLETEDALGWFGWNEPLAGLRLIRYDARGHGKASAPRGTDTYNWRNLGADMLAVADSMDAPRFIAGGMSMGAASAIHAAVQAPDRIKGLILAMPPMIWEHRAAQREMYRRIAQRGIEADGRALAKLMSRDLARTLPPWLTEASPGITASLAIGVRALDRRIIPDLFHGAAISDLPPRASLDAIAHVPALILAWTGDATHPLHSAQELHALLPNSALHIAASHAEFLQFPGQIRAFAAGRAVSD